MEERLENYDQVLEKIGQLGPWQKRIIIFLWIPPILAGMGFMQYSFAVGTPSQYRCLIPFCESYENETSQPEFNKTWIHRFMNTSGSTEMRI